MSAPNRRPRGPGPGGSHRNGAGAVIARRLLMPLVMTLVVALVPPAPAGAADLGAAEARYREGAMRTAAALARQADGAEGFALAAKAGLVDAVYLAPASDRRARLEQAAADARRALERDPDHVEAHLHLAIALGHLADLEDPVSAHVKGYAAEAKAHLDRALALEPDNAWAHGLLGMWHLQIVRRADAALARSLYGATEKEGVARCAKAAALAPEEPALRLGCAVSLYELDPATWRRRAMRSLAAVSRMPAADAAARLIRADARGRLARLTIGSPKGG